MITGFFLNIGYSLAAFLLGLLPSSVGFPTEIRDAIEYILGVMQGFNAIFPIETLLEIFILATLWEVAILAWKISRYVLGILRGTKA